MAGVEEASVVVVLVADMAEAAEASMVVVVVSEEAAGTSVAVALVHRTQALEEWATAEAESVSACLALQVESHTLRIGPRMSIHLDRLDHLCGKVLADVRRVA
jgi:hypothetical protein